jgi:hypothetical protein
MANVERKVQFARSSIRSNSGEDFLFPPLLWLPLVKEHVTVVIALEIRA